MAAHAKRIEHTVTSNSVSTDDLQVPGYDIIERIGKGGMASVYRARQHTFDRNVALKVLKPDLSEDEQFCQRFVQESLIVAKLSHSHIVQVYDVGEFQTTFYIAMEYLPGGDLHTRLEGGLSVRDTLTLLRQSASALSFAHQKGIVHRDIKPDNVMFREDGAAVLTDFGIAKELSSDMNLTQTGLIVGTPKYMAPEQIRGGNASPQSDLYSLGVLLYQCLTDRVPFDGKDMIATAYKHFNEPVPVLPSVLAELQPILDRLLAKKASDRYESAQQLIDDLDRLNLNAQATTLTNLDIARLDTPASALDPTLVQPHNADTLEFDSPEDGDDTVITQTVPQAPPRAQPKSKWMYAIGAAGTLAAIALIVTQLPPMKHEATAADVAVVPSLRIEQTAPPSAPLDPSEHSQDPTQTLTIERLVYEALIDISERRLKKPDANNAFDKLQRVLDIDADNPRALAAMEQIAEEYAKLAETALNGEELGLAAAYLEHGRSASAELASLKRLEQRLAEAEARKQQHHASISQMERELMIEGLLESAAIDEAEGRFFSVDGNGALAKYKRVLELDPLHPVALEKVAAVPLP